MRRCRMAQEHNRAGSDLNKNILVPIVAAFLSACATNRDTPSDYERINSGKVPSSSVSFFRDCVSDKFRDRVAGIGVTWLNRQQRRSDGYRVELVSQDTGALISADIFEDGRVELFETTYLVRIRLQDEREGFARCLSKYKSTP